MTDDLQPVWGATAPQSSLPTLAPNQLNMLKICVKTLIENSIGYATALDDSFHPLKQLTILLETVMRHGMKKGRMNLLVRKGLWSVFEGLERHVPDSAEVYAKVKALELKTNDGRARAWIRLALQQQLMMDTFRIVTTEGIVDDYYDPYAFMMGEEAQVCAGLIVGLNIIECNFKLESYMLDGLPVVLDYSMYLKDGNYLKPGTDRSNDTDDRFSEHNFIVLQDQKMLLQEKFKTINARSIELEEIVAEKEVALVPLKAQIAKLEDENQQLQEQVNDSLEKIRRTEMDFESRIAEHSADIETERTTYEHSRSGLNEMYAAMQKQLETEQAMRESVEADMNKLQTAKKQLDQEAEDAQKEIEKNQETTNALRSQLKEVKDLNLMMLENMQEAKGQVKEFEMQVHTKSEEIEGLKRDVAVFRTQLQTDATNRERLEQTILELSDRLQDIDAKRATLETNVAIERQFRETLQTDLEQEKRKVVELQPLVGELDESKQQFTELNGQHEDLKKSYAEQEQTLVDLGSHISEEKLKLNEIESNRRRTREQTWQDNSEANACTACKKKFGVTRRCVQLICTAAFVLTGLIPESQRAYRHLRHLWFCDPGGHHLATPRSRLQNVCLGIACMHAAASAHIALQCNPCSHDLCVVFGRKHHCRSCGGIFCNDCSDNKMPLPHSAKPVRVCDPCYQRLLSEMSK